MSRFSIWMSRGMEKHLRKYPDITKNTSISWCLEFWKNMGAEYELKHSVLAEAQKSTDYTQIVQRLKDVKSMERNAPFLNPPDDYILKEYTGLVVLGDEI